MQKKNRDPTPKTHGLCSNVEFQPSEPPIRLQLFVSNRRRYGHKWAAMLRPLMTRALRLKCVVVHSAASNISHARACKPEVDGGDWRKKNCDLALKLFSSNRRFPQAVYIVSELVQVTHQLA